MKIDFHVSPQCFFYFHEWFTFIWESWKCLNLMWYKHLVSQGISINLKGKFVAADIKYLLIDIKWESDVMIWEAHAISDQTGLYIYFIRPPSLVIKLSNLNSSYYSFIRKEEWAILLSQPSGSFLKTSQFSISWVQSILCSLAQAASPSIPIKQISKSL